MDKRMSQEYVTSSRNVVAADNGKVFLVGHPSVSFSFASASSLGADFKVTIKKVSEQSFHVPIYAYSGERVDVYYPEIRLIQPMDSVDIIAFVNPTTGIGGLFTLSGSYYQGAMRGHRTINAAACNNDAYNVSAFDYGILHRCVPPGTAGGQVALYLPPLSQVTGTNPDGSLSYLSKTFFFQLAVYHPAGAAIIATGGTTINGLSRIDLHTAYAGLMVQAAGDQWWAQALGGAGANV
jgi:hypothetical protein